MDGKIDGYMDRRMDEQMDEWMDEWTNGWSTFTQKGLGKTKTEYINFLSIVVATSRNMT